MNKQILIETDMFYQSRTTHHQNSYVIRFAMGRIIDTFKKKTTRVLKLSGEEQD